MKTAMRLDPFVATLVAMCIVSTNAMAPGTTSVDETQTHAADSKPVLENYRGVDLLQP